MFSRIYEGTNYKAINVKNVSSAFEKVFTAYKF